jgi:hypothetical protein
MTSIYSKADGIVQWKASLLPQSKLTQNIEVDCSHCGMATAPAVIYLFIRLVEQYSLEKFTPIMNSAIYIIYFNPLSITFCFC